MFYSKAAPDRFLQAPSGAAYWVRVIGQDRHAAPNGACFPERNLAIDMAS